MPLLKAALRAQAWHGKPSGWWMDYLQQEPEALTVGWDMCVSPHLTPKENAGVVLGLWFPVSLSQNQLG